jgi:hypothetical protein
MRISRSCFFASFLALVGVEAWGRQTPGDGPLKLRQPPQAAPEPKPERKLDFHPALKVPDAVPARRVEYAVIPARTYRLSLDRPIRGMDLDLWQKGVEGEQQWEADFFATMGMKGWLLISAPNPLYPYYVFMKKP